MGTRTGCRGRLQRTGDHKADFDNRFGQLPPFPKAILDQIAGNATTARRIERESV